jgi:hypothetical protein
MFKAKLVKAFIVTMFLLPLGGQVTGKIDSIVSECANVIALRNTVEDYVRTVKARLKRGSRDYMQVEDSYSRTSEAYEGFVRSLDSEKAANVKALEAQQEIKAFIERCQAALGIDHLTDLEEPRYNEFVSAFFTALTQKRKSLRAEWTRTVQNEIAWSSWDRIR